MNWSVNAHGHLVEDGRRVESITDLIRSSDENLIIEEYDVFALNKYSDAALEIFDDAWRRIAAVQPNLAVNIEALYLFRAFRRGKREYAPTGDPLIEE